MIICPNCNHQNPEGSVQCENCYTPLPSTYPCSNCGTFVQSDATFCGQCGFNLQGTKTNTSQIANDNLLEESDLDYSLEEDLIPTAVKNEVSTDPFQSPWDLEDEEEDSLTEESIPPLLSLEDMEAPQIPISPVEEAEITQPSVSPFDLVIEEEEPEEEDLLENLDENEDLELWISSVKEESLENEQDLEEIKLEIEEVPQLSTQDDFESTPQFADSDSEEELLELGEFSAPPLVEEETNLDAIAETEPVVESTSPEIASIPDTFSQLPANADASTRLQIQEAILFHTQTGNTLEIPPSLAVVRIGKTNDRVPPDIDVSGFPNAEIVSRVHADIRVEGDTYFIEDLGSSNGTYINNSPLLVGNRHRLRTGDRISLGKGDLVTFLFQIN